METEEGEGAAVEHRIGKTMFRGFLMWHIYEEGNVAIAKGAICNDMVEIGESGE